MKKILFALALVCLPMAACASLPHSPPSLSETTADEKALYAAEASYNAALRAVSVAVDAGAVRGTSARQASDLLARAYAGLRAARTAQRAGNLTILSDQVAEVVSFIQQIRALPGVPQ